MSMLRIIRPLPKGEKSAERLRPLGLPKESPTVATADTVSKRAGNSFMSLGEKVRASFFHSVSARSMATIVL